MDVHLRPLGVNAHVLGKKLPIILNVVENGKSELPVRFSIYLMHPIDLDPY
jgi:hypothetical protein